GSKNANGARHERPDVTLIVAAFPFACVRERLARVAGRDPVDGFDLRPVRRGEVAVVGDAGESFGEDFRRMGVVLRMPRDGAADDGLQTEFESADTGAERADAHHPFATSRTSPLPDSARRCRAPRLRMNSDVEVSMRAHSSHASLICDSSHW